MGSIRSIQGCRRWTSETPGFYPHSARGGRITPLALFALPQFPIAANLPNIPGARHAPTPTAPLRRPTLEQRRRR
ncbi:hypothetical protein BH603_18865, partial [Pseudomonas aeruginosa]